jgi:hypothetical protein
MMNCSTIQILLRTLRSGLMTSVLVASKGGPSFRHLRFVSPQHKETTSSRPPTGYPLSPINRLKPAVPARGRRGVEPSGCYGRSAFMVRMHAASTAGRLISYRGLAASRVLLHQRIRTCRTLLHARIRPILSWRSLPPRLITARPPVNESIHTHPSFEPFDPTSTGHARRLQESLLSLRPNLRHQTGA